MQYFSLAINKTILSLLLILLEMVSCFFPSKESLQLRLVQAKDFQQQLYIRTL
jgi:hypothetical protein